VIVRAVLAVEGNTITMQIYDLSAVDGALVCGGLLVCLRPVRFVEVIAGLVALATLLAVHWAAPYPAYIAASIICPLSFVAYVLRSRGIWQRMVAVRAEIDR
jgi:hypothetical protein